MIRRAAVWLLLFSAASAAAWAQQNAKDAVMIPVDEIVRKNADARGGVDAWRKIETMAWSGRAESARTVARSANFLLEQKRPGKSRFEFSLDQQKSVRVFDGQQGWKIRPGSGGRPETAPFTAEEIAFARDGQVIDGPIMDFVAKGLVLNLESLDAVEGKPAYRLAVRGPSGLSHRVWVDAESFLEVRLDRLSRGPEGRTRATSVMYRNYRTFEGLQLPTVIETGIADSADSPVEGTDRLIVERVALNPEIDDPAFDKPLVASSRRGRMVVDTRPAQPGTGQAARPASQ